MDKLLAVLEKRFNDNMHRHKDVSWQDVKDKLNNKVMGILQKMEDTGGKPDVIKYEGIVYYVDFSKESPEQRRSLCYDEKAWQDRKKFKPESSVEKHADQMGVKLINEPMYSYMQALEDFDLKTSSWIETPDSIRSLGGALNAEKRYQRTFIFHNGADSYYASRGYRGFIKL